ncbi:MAG: T9SS type A sorting domain-containing protein [Bacteroidota bacterium]|nr:T9SS type A sorting domain-containing protein [Bacteroidota bacterium]
MRFSTNYSTKYIILFLMITANLTAQWSTNPAINNVISTATGEQTNSTIASDGSGGAIIVWQDSRSGTSYDIYVQKISVSGVVQWTTDGIAISTPANDQMYPTIVSDGSGGAIITWNDARSGNLDIYAQKINAFGVVQWATNGIAISTAASDQTNPTIVSDGSGGAIITWADIRGGTYYDIYTQRINASGAVQWTADGVVISNATNDQYLPTIAIDGSGGAIITWQDVRSGTDGDIYVQRINAAGIVQWTADGVVISNAYYDQNNSRIVSDGSGGAIITWNDLRSGINNDIYAQKINSSGAVQWTADGVVISNATDGQTNPTLVSDGSGGAIITWTDYRSGTSYDIYAQKISVSGVVLWAANGVAISTTTGEQFYPAIISDGSGGAIITWTDFRSGTNYDIYTQRINTAGTVQWKANGEPVSTATGSQQYSTIVSDGFGGAIITWIDFRNGTNYDIYAQRVDRYRFLGIVEPSISSIADIPSDQGGKIRLKWNKSALDTLSDTWQITYYGLWRRIPPGSVASLRSSVTLAKTMNDTLGTLYDFFTTVPAVQSPTYNVVVQTLTDSTSTSTYQYRYLVTAHTSDPNLFILSAEDSGYSVDNIPPIGVGSAMISVNGGGILLKWSKNRVDGDLMEYRIYRSTTAGFMIGSGTQLSTTIDTTYNDPSGTNGTSYYYRIAAIDVHGNLGTPSNELNETALSVELSSFVVSPNRRNANIAWSVATETNNFGYDIERRSMDTDGSNFQRVGFVEGNGTSQLARQYSYSDRNVGSGVFAYRLKQIDRNGQYTFSRTVEVKMGVAPNVFELAQNYPNPFNPTTNIEFTVPVTGQAMLKIFNAIGQEVATLFDGIAEAGEYHQRAFDAKNLSSGIYFAKLQNGDKVQMKKMMLIK